MQKSLNLFTQEIEGSPSRVSVNVEALFQKHGEERGDVVNLFYSRIINDDIDKLDEEEWMYFNDAKEDIKEGDMVYFRGRSWAGLRKGTAVVILMNSEIVDYIRIEFVDQHEKFPDGLIVDRKQVKKIS